MSIWCIEDYTYQEYSLFLQCWEQDLIVKNRQEVPSLQDQYLFVCWKLGHHWDCHQQHHWVEKKGEYRWEYIQTNNIQMSLYSAYIMTWQYFPQMKKQKYGLVQQSCQQKLLQQNLEIWFNLVSSCFLNV